MKEWSRRQLRHLKWWLLGLVRGKAYVHGLRMEHLMRGFMLEADRQTGSRLGADLLKLVDAKHPSVTHTK